MVFAADAAVDSVTPTTGCDDGDVAASSVPLRQETHSVHSPIAPQTTLDRRRSGARRRGLRTVEFKPLQSIGREVRSIGSSRCGMGGGRDRAFAVGQSMSDDRRDRFDVPPRLLSAGLSQHARAAQRR